MLNWGFFNFRNWLLGVNFSLLSLGENPWAGEISFLNGKNKNELLYKIMQIMLSDFNQKNKTEKETGIRVPLCPSGGSEGPWGCSGSLPTIPFQILLWYNTVLLSFICPLFLLFAMEILGYFVVGGGLVPLVWYSSGGGKAFVGEKFINWLESQLWDQKVFFASEFFLRKLRYWASALPQKSTSFELHFSK